jgi:hypothetical protein
MAVVHQVLSRREEYVELGGDYYDRRNKPKTVARLAGRLARLSYHVSLRPNRAGVQAGAGRAAPERSGNRGQPHSSSDSGRRSRRPPAQTWPAL